MITDAIIVANSPASLNEEGLLLRNELTCRGIPVQLASRKQIERGRIELRANQLVAGPIDAVHIALRVLGVEIPRPNDYPGSLSRFLHRRIWKSRLEEVLWQMEAGSGPPVFIKPAGRQKRFTGFVMDSPSDFHILQGCSRKEAVWCSETVKWLSEYRVFVVKNTIVGQHCYAGDATVTLNSEIVSDAVAALSSTHEAPAGYGVDFGVLASGETALIEFNDGFGLGAYGLPGCHYADLIIARWEELTKMAGTTGAKLYQPPGH